MATLASPCSSPSPVNGPGAHIPKQPSALYSMIMTPINLTVFLLSLVIVDLRYSLVRTDNASGRAGDATGGLPPWLLQWLPSWLGRWLRRLVLWCRPQSRQQQHAAGHWDGDTGRGYYHSKQKKLMKMEADEAFQLYGIVLFVLAVLSAAGVVIVYHLASHAYYRLWPLISVSE